MLPRVTYTPNSYDGNKTDMWALSVELAALALPFEPLMLEVPPADTDPGRECRSWVLQVVCMVRRE